MLGILRAEALPHIKAFLLKLGIMGCGRRPRWEIRGVFLSVEPSLKYQNNALIC
jgi:hypothetical protein